MDLNLIQIKLKKSFDNGSKLSIENDGGELNMSPDRRYVTANNPNKKGK